MSPIDPNPSREPRPINEAHLPYGVRLIGAWSWRVIAFAVAAALLVWGLRELSHVVVPIAVACLLSVLLHPLVNWLNHKAGLARVWSSLIAVLGMIVVVAGLLSLAGAQLASGLRGVATSVTQGLDQIQNWLASGPLKINGEQLSQWMERAREALSANSSMLTSGAMSIGSGAGAFLAGLLIALIATFFFLLEGHQIWTYFVRWLPRSARNPVYQASRRGWVSLGSYARTQVIVAGVDAIGIAIGAFFLGLPFVLPIFVLVFVSSFVPIVGAIVSGAIAVLIALVFKGWVTALIMLGVVLAVQQLESHVLQPFLMGRAVSLHPLAVILAVASGSFLLGIVGALFAVPVLATVNSVGRYLAGDDPFPDLGEEQEPELLPRRERLALQGREAASDTTASDDTGATTDADAKAGASPKRDEARHTGPSSREH